MEDIYAFIDECGDTATSTDKQGVSGYFIITAVIIKKKDFDVLKDQLQRLVKGTEIKSSNFRNNEKGYSRREQLLKEVEKFNFMYYTLVVDKSEIYPDSGLNYKQTFFKRVNRILHKELYLSFPRLYMIADQHGRSEFMDSFIKYVMDKHKPRLDEVYEFGFIDSKDSVLVQLADLISGTISFGYEDYKDKTQYDRFHNLLKDKEIELVEWPPKTERYLSSLKKHNDGYYDDLIITNSIRSADEFITKNENSNDQTVIAQVHVLKYLKLCLINKSADYYANAHEIINRLQYLMEIKFSIRFFRTKIIANLRDNNVLISSSNQGYKLPVCENDLYSFVNHTNKNIEPMFARLKKARSRIKLVTNGELDILSKDEYKNLRDYLDNFK